MKRWSDLAAAALLGTSRTSVPSFPASDAPLDMLLCRLEEETPERRLLTSAALLTVWGQAGARPFPAPTLLPTPALSDERPPCPPRAARHLTEILQGAMAAMLEEWLEALAAAGRSLPHRWLPELLDLASQKDELGALISPLLDARARWLAAQHPEWQELLIPSRPEELVIRWETGSRRVRLALLRHLRATDPSTSLGAGRAQARDLLGSTWTEESAKDRATFLATLAVGLSPADEPFLESTLEDRSKEVRNAAAKLLAGLPESALVGRMRARLQSLFHLERRLLGQSRLLVSLPKACDESMVRDGVEQKPPAGMGERAWWLLQMLAAVPPATWSQTWDKTPGELIGLAGKTEYEPVLLEGWGWGALRHRDGAWVEMLLRHWMNSPWTIVPSGKTSIFNEKLADLLQVVPQKRLEDWLTDLVRSRYRALDEADSLFNVLVAHRCPWGAALTRAFLDGLRFMAAKSKPAYSAWRWRSALLEFARYASPAMADEAERGWPTESTWAAQVDQFLAILHFRREMLKAAVSD